MSDGETTGSERTSVGVVAPETDASRIVEAITDAGGVADASAATATDSDAIVAVGDAGLSDLAAAGSSSPILPVGIEGIDAVRPEDARQAIERFLAGEYEIRNRPLVRVETDANRGHALFDSTLTSAEPAIISEFAVEMLDSTASRGSADGPVARFRADGVVVATPAGSRGYARAAGGSVVIPGSDVFSVVPISPFSTDPDHWVLPLSGLALSVERDEVDVTLSVDGRSLCTVTPGSTVRLTPDDTLQIAVVSESNTKRKWETF